MYVVALNTGERPISKSLFAAMDPKVGGQLGQIFSCDKADIIAARLTSIGSGNGHQARTLAFPLHVNHPAVTINPRTNYVRIDAARYAQEQLKQR